MLMVVIPERAPADETSRPEEFNENVSSLALPIVIIFALTFVPIRILPVVPESRVSPPVVPDRTFKAEAAADDKVTAPAPVYD
jgi:hypothetical protein